ncbi:CDP-glycerol glycerophosphotransferase family protein, partial [Streptomyces cyaneofuscatus]
MSVVEGDTEFESPLTPLSSSSGSSGSSGSADAFRRYRAVFSLDRLTTADLKGTKTRSFKVTLKGADGQDREALLAEDFTTGRHALAPGRELSVHRDERGRLMLATRAVRPVVDAMTVTAAGELVVEGTYPREEAAGKKVILRDGTRLEEKELPVELADGRFTVRIDPEAAPQVS